MKSNENREKEGKYMTRQEREDVGQATTKVINDMSGYIQYLMDIRSRETDELTQLALLGTCETLHSTYETMMHMLEVVRIPWAQCPESIAEMAALAEAKEELKKQEKGE